MINLIANNIFILNFILTLIWGIIFLVPSNQITLDGEHKRKTFIIICCIQWVLISSLRADSVGADTVNYMRLFDVHNNMSWEAVLLAAKDYYFGSEVAVDYELGYVIFEKLIGSISSSHLFYKMVIATIFMSALGVFIYKNSEDPFISFIIYDALMYNMFSLTGYRQVVSVAIGILFGYEYIKKRKFIPFLILVLVASLFHKSTLFFIVFYFLADKKITQKYLIVISALIMFLLIERYRVFNYVKVIIGYEQYSGTYGFAQQTFLVLLVLLTVAIIVCHRQIMWYAKNISFEYTIHYDNALILTWLTVPMAMVSPTSMRVVYDFGFISFLLYIPMLVKSFYDFKNRIIVYVSLSILLGFFVLTRTPEYIFFWQI